MKSYSAVTVGVTVTVTPKYFERKALMESYSGYSKKWSYRVKSYIQYIYKLKFMLANMCVFHCNSVTFLQVALFSMEWRLQQRGRLQSCPL